MLKPLIDFSIREVCPKKLFGQPLCKDYSRLHLEELKRNYWPSPSSSLWQLDETTRLDCVTTLASSMGRLNQKHISTMANTSNASQSTTMAPTNSKLGKPKWKESKKKMSVKCSHYFSKSNSWNKKIRSCGLRWLSSVACKAITTLPSLPTLTGVTTKWHALRRHIESSHQMHKEGFFSSCSPTWPKQPYASIDQPYPNEAGSSSRGKRKMGQRRGFRLSRPSCA